MTWGLTAVAAATVYSASKSSSAAKDAANTQAQAAQEGLAAQERMFNKQIELQEPWRQAGINALGKLGTGFTGQVDLKQDPGYQFRLSEGMKALERSAAARGGLISGGALKAASRYGQDYASNEYQNAYNRALTQYNTSAALAGIGQTATNALTGAAGQYGTAANEAYQNAANARASGYVGSANALNQAVGTGANLYMQNQWMNRLPSYTSTGNTGYTPTTDYSVGANYTLGGKL